MVQLGDSPTGRRRRLHRAPLVPVALSLACGIGFGVYGPLAWGFWAALVVAGLVTAVVTALRKHLHLATWAAVMLAVAALGAVAGRAAYFSVADDHVVTYTGRSAILSTLRGRIVTSPQIYRPSSDVPASYRRPRRTSFVLRPELIKTHASKAQPGWDKVSGLVRVTVFEPAFRLRPGQQVELVGKLGRYRPPSNPGQHDWAKAARISRTLVWMTVPLAEGATILAGENPPWYARAYWHVRASVRQRLAGYGDAVDEKLLSALIIGERHPALRTLSRAMVRAGIAHFLSISGLHLGVFLGVIYLLCRLIALSPRRSAGVVLVVLAAYVLMSEPRAPVIRSAIMAAMLCVATMLGRRHTALNALAAAAIILLAIDPLELFQVGFQLSFVIVAGLLLLHAPVRQLLFGRWLRRRGLMVFRGDQRMRRWLYYTLANAVIGAVTMALVAYAVAAPLVAYHFGLVSPYAPLLSIVLFPLVLAILVPGYISMALAWAMPNLSYSIGDVARAAAACLRSMVDLAANLPGLSFQLRPVGMAWVLVCYAAIVLVVAHRRLRFGKVWAAISILIVLGWGVYTQRTARPPHVAQLDVLAVGAGQCAILRTPSGRTYVFDAGTRSPFDAYENVIGPFLLAQRLPGPSAVFISHANTDHYNAVGSILRLGGTREVYLNEYFGRGGRTGLPPAVGVIMRSFAESGVRIRRLRAGEEISLDGRTKLEVLWPPAKRRDDLDVNDTSLVLRVTCDGHSVLLPGDIKAVGLGELARGGRGVRAGVLIMPHHGGWAGTLGAFVDAVEPRYVVVSGSREPRPPANSPRAADGFYRRLKTNYRYFSTRRDGWIRISFGLGGTEIETMR